MTCVIEVIQSAVFAKWLLRLKDRNAAAIITDRLLRMQKGNLGDVKPVGGGVNEARIHYSAGYRLYFIRRGELLIIMLGGGDKSSQKRDIKQAKALAEQWR